MELLDFKSPKSLLVLAILAASLSLNMILGLAAIRYYMLLNQTRLDPLGLLNSQNRPKQQTAARRVVVIGDSRAGAWPAPLGIESTEVINHGMSGHTTTQVLGRFQQHIADLEPDVVLIQAGINDLKTIPLFPERQDEIVEQCKQNIRDLALRSVDTGATVIVTTIIPGGRVPLVRMPFWPRKVDQAVEDCNASIKTLASERVLVFDTAAIVAGSNGRVQPRYQQDFLHLNKAGYGALNQELVTKLNAIP